MYTLYFLYGVAATLLVETVVLKIVAAWMEKEIREEAEDGKKAV